ncbi:1442_t:CDS:1, partial [Dentiscutata heterogama]
FVKDLNSLKESVNNLPVETVNSLNEISNDLVVVMEQLNDPGPYHELANKAAELIISGNNVISEVWRVVEQL